MIMSKYYKYGDAQYRASERYKKANIKRIVLSLNKNTDQDIIAFLGGLDNVTGEIKRILREEIERNG